MTSELFSSVLTKDKIFTTECNENWNVFALNLVWEIKVEKEISILTIHPHEIKSGQLHYNEDHENKILDLTGWQFEIYKTEERISPFQFYIIDCDMDFKNKKLIASI